ncbi:LysR family transcriptional regulator [Streptomyces triticagri]|uniref:LysR family transcriptional regulator n=1 Tax=Streptomyces triticagri TaxID=2293568 RepID=A0A372LZ31_9ACTN|nr:LysR substrate-binding domain-containing protein [Streptomyces triticagri]RFU83819.1 LysR family transcriptional regulator [Streptomyces triticagri]
MDLRQLEYFIAVAEEANFTRAAERVHISQPGISAQIRQLEHELGAALIDRSGRTATLTAAGEAALGPARMALAAAESVRRSVDEVNGLIRGRLVVGMITACTLTPLFDALAAFHRSHPGVQITLIEDNSDQLVELVRSNQADLALIGAADTAPEGLDSLPIVSEKLVVAVPKGHPLSGRRSVRLDDIGEYSIISLPVGTGIRAVFDRACAAHGLRPNVALQASAPASVADLAARGLGVAVLSESMASAHRDKLHFIPLDGVDAPAVLALVWSATTSGPALRELLERCRRAFGVAPADDGEDTADGSDTAESGALLAAT